MFRLRAGVRAGARVGARVRAGLQRFGLVAALLVAAVTAGCVDPAAPSQVSHPARDVAACELGLPCLGVDSGPCTASNAGCLCDANGMHCCPRDTFCNRGPSPAGDTAGARLRIRWARGPNADGSFTTLAGERTLTLAAAATPERLASTVTWSVVDDPGDAARGTVPTGPAPAGATSSLDVPRQTTERWRLPHGSALSARALAFRVVAELPAEGGRRAERDSTVVRQREVDVLRQEYADFGIPVPGVGDVKTAADIAGSTRFGWSQLNQGDYAVVVLKPVLLAGLEELAAKSDRPLSLSSVFRNPAHHRFHISVSGGSAKALLSQHQYGTAVDIRTYRSLPVWNELRVLAKRAGACAEPLNISTSDHVHADWRTGAPKCPPGW